MVASPVVLDRQPAPAAAAPGRIAPTPGATGAAPQVSVAAKPPAALRTPLHDAALAASLADSTVTDMARVLVVGNTEIMRRAAAIQSRVKRS